MVGSAFGLIGPAIGIGTQLFGGGDNASYGPVPTSANIPNLSIPNQNEWWGNYQNLISGLMNGPNYPAQNYDKFAGQVGNLMNTDAAGWWSHGAENASNMAPQVAGMQMGGAQGLYGAGQAGLPYASKILEMGFDPQDAYYNRAAGRLTDQTMAQLARSGVANTPYGQSVYGGTMGNFNLDWQNQALQRANQGIQGYGGLGAGMGQQFGAASNLGNQAMNTTYTGASLPYQAIEHYINQNLGALGQLNNAGMQTYALPQQAIGDISAMITHQQAANQLGSQMQNQLFNQNQALGQAFGSNIAGLSQGLGTIFGNQNWFGGGGAQTGNSQGGGMGDIGWGGSGGYDWGSAPWDAVF